MTWKGVGDVVGSKGFNSGSIESIGYNVGQADGFNYISVYGWFTNPLTEYYITELGSLSRETVQYLKAASRATDTPTTRGSTSSRTSWIEGTQTFEQYLDAWGGSTSDQISTTNSVSFMGGSRSGSGGSSGGAAACVAAGHLSWSARRLIFTGAVDASGGNGNNAAANNTGAGGGGGGGIVVMAAETYSANTGTMSVQGGTTGSCGSYTGCGAGGAGGAGMSKQFTIQ